MWFRYALLIGVVQIGVVMKMVGTFTEDSFKVAVPLKPANGCFVWTLTRLAAFARWAGREISPERDRAPPSIRVTRRQATRPSA
jgi:hypothetical protein